ncbi:MAG: pseudouridine synthase [Rhizobiaceae bacterium]|nr:pseudouridine synthase [Rhizobiaceae bacterium]
MTQDRQKFQRRPDTGGKGKRPGPAKKSHAAASGEAERIAKRLARAGVASRREAEAMIAAGRISVNGKVIDSPALNVGGSDKIEVDGAPIPEIERTRLFLYHKPAGLVTTNRDPEGRKTVFESLPSDLPRVVTVGRLDINTEGLLLLTNDGGLSRVLELPSTGWLRRYRVRVHGKVDEKALADLKDGIAVDGVFYGAVEASLDRVQGSNAWLTLGLREGKNREVRNILSALGLEVTRLIRVSYGPFQLGEMAEGEVRELRGRTLRDQLGERLIAEAGANFEAPVINPRSPEKAGGASAPRGRDAKGFGGKDDRREATLARWSTKEPRRDDAAGKDGEKRPATERRSRASNVWMAPGARPSGPKAASAKAAKSPVADPNRRFAKKPEKGESEARRRDGKPSAKSSAGTSGKHAAKPAGKTFSKPGPKGPRPGGKQGGRPDAGRRR